MGEKRIATRHRVLKAGTIEFGGAELTALFGTFRRPEQRWKL
jgi:hypothetical protein